MKPKPMDRRIASIKAFGDEGDHTFEFIANSGQPDRLQEVLDAEGCDYEMWMKNPVLLFAHDDWSLPIGKGLELDVDGEALVGKGEFASEAYPFAALVEDMYRSEMLSGFSVRFLPREWTVYEEGSDERNAGIRRRCTDWELLEISVVDIPCDPLALRKAYDAGNEGEVRRMVKAATMLGTAPAQRELPLAGVSFKTWEDCAGAMARLLRGGMADLPEHIRRSYYDELTQEYGRFERAVPEFKQYGPTEAAMAAFGIDGTAELVRILEPHIKQGVALDLEGDGLLVILEGKDETEEKGVEPAAAPAHIFGPEEDELLVEVLDGLKQLYV